MKILFINPNKWGRGITSIWIASHSALLKKFHHEVQLFDCTFYSEWTNNELNYNTNNSQYKKTNYKNFVDFINKTPLSDLKKKVEIFGPDIIFWSALSSHIHGEGEYVNIEYGYDLIKDLSDKSLKITGGIQATASPKEILNRYPKINYLISGESEFVLLEICNNLSKVKKIDHIKGLTFYKDDKIIQNNPQDIINNLDEIPLYDYDIFDPKVFFRPYNGNVIKALDYEMSRGCIYTCSYCVETVIQKYYGFSETTETGSLKQAKKYLRSKSAKRIYEELKNFVDKFSIDLVRCQDTNFLTINRKVLDELRILFLCNPLKIKLYIETRPEGINEKSVELLKILGVDGVGMGVELSGEEFRKKNLNRFANQKRIIEAFKLLKDAGIKRTSYNIIGLPDQNEESILSTIEFNKILRPDNVTVAFYSPYYGTNEQIKSVKLNYFDEYEKKIDGQLRSLSKSNLVSIDKLNFYKENFNRLVFENV